MEIRDLLSVLRSRWVLIVASTLIGGLLALGSSLLIEPTYQTGAKFYVTIAAGDSAASAYQGSLGAQQRVQSYAGLVKSTDVAGKVAAETKVNLTEAEIANRTRATADQRTVLLSVMIEDERPERALLIAEGYTTVLPDVIRELETPEGGGVPAAKLTVVDPPTLPQTPIAPNTGLNIAVGIGLGLFVGIGSAVLMNSVDRRIKTPQQVQDIAGAPIVGSIPFRKDEDRVEGQVHIVPFREGHSAAAEAFRRLRTNLQFLSVDKPARVIVITSSVAQEGKSETAVNLSLALAEAGHRVLLVEADLRRPRVVNYLAMPDNVGLTNILSGQAEFEDVVQATRHADADLLACGPLPPNPSELLASEAARQLIDRVRALYDYVIIDSPPLLPVTDGALLSRASDGALLVVRENSTRVDQVAQSAENLARADANLLGVILVANKPAKRGTVDYYDSYYPSAKHPSELEQSGPRESGK